MSRIGKMPVKIQSGVKIDFKGRLLKVEGPKGKLSYEVPESVELNIETDEIKVLKKEGDKRADALQGTVRTLIYNMVHGVHTGFTKTLNIIGVGYRAAVSGKKLTLNLGFSHPIDYPLPEGIEAKVVKNTELSISGPDKVLVGMVSAKIRSFRPPEPYQGKGVKYSDERIVRKQGKAAGSK